MKSTVIQDKDKSEQKYPCAKRWLFNQAGDNQDPFKLGTKTLIGWFLSETRCVILVSDVYNRRVGEVLEAAVAATAPNWGNFHGKIELTF